MGCGAAEDTQEEEEEEEEEEEGLAKHVAADRERERERFPFRSLIPGRGCSPQIESGRSLTKRASREWHFCPNLAIVAHKGIIPRADQEKEEESDSVPFALHTDRVTPAPAFHPPPSDTFPLISLLFSGGGEDSTFSRAVLIQVSFLCLVADEDADTRVAAVAGRRRRRAGPRRHRRQQPAARGGAGALPVSER